MANVTVNTSLNKIEGIKAKGESTIYDLVDKNARSAIESIQISLDNTYEVSENADTEMSPQINDSFQTAIQKLNKTIDNDEIIVSLSLNDINARINQIESTRATKGELSNIIGNLGNKFEATEATYYTAEDEEVIAGTKNVGDVKTEAIAAVPYTNVAEVIEDDEEVWATAMSDLNDKYEQLASDVNNISSTQGPQGNQGMTGAQGVKGAQGDKGVQGPQGETGVQGAQGTQGVIGMQGPQGETGVQGAQGTQGVIGMQGPQGATGSFDASDLDGYATEQFVTEKIGEVVGAAPEALDTLKEIADVLDNEDSVAGGLIQQITGLQTSLIIGQQGQQGLSERISGLQAAIEDNEKTVASALTDLNNRDIIGQQGQQGLSEQIAGLQTALIAGQQGQQGLSEQIAGLQTSLIEGQQGQQGLSERISGLQASLIEGQQGQQGLSEQIAGVQTSLSNNVSNILDIIEDNEKTVASALTDLNNRDIIGQQGQQGLSEQIAGLQTAIENINSRLGNFSFVKLTSEQYENLVTKDPNTLYIIND